MSDRVMSLLAQQREKGPFDFNQNENMLVVFGSVQLSGRQLMSNPVRHL